MSNQQFCLKWNNHTSNMLNVFEHLLSTEALVDVTLACDGLSLKAHKMVLSACSPFFQSLFLENPCKHPIVIMKDMSYKDLKAIIDFMYRGEVNVSQDQLSALLKTAETLKVKGLAEVSGENRQASGVVQQEITTPQTPSSQTPQQQNSQQQQQSMRPESPPMHGKRKRGRPRKRSLSDSNRSDDELVPSKIKEPDSPEIEELSGDASMDAGGDMLRSNSASSQSQVHHQPSVNTFSSSKHHSAPSQHQVNAQVEEPPSGDDNEFEVEPSKLLEQTLTTDNVPSTASSTMSSSHFNLPSSSGIEISQIGMGDSQALVPVSAASDSLSSSHLQGPDSPQDIKPAILTFDEPPISPVPGPSHQSDRSMMMYMDQSSMPGPSNYQDQSLVQHDSQPQGMSRIAQEKRIDVKKELSSEVTDGCVEGKHTLSLKLRSRIRNQQLTANSNENEQTLDNEQAVMPGRKRACVISSRELTNSSSNMDTAKPSSAECACKEQHEKFQNEVFGILKNILLEVKSLKSTVPQVHVPQECESSVVPEQLPACPLATMNDLVEMEFMLQDNENFQSLSNYLSTIGGTSKKDVMRRILRSLISNPLAITLNWKGQRGNKTAFSEMKNTVRLIHSATQKCLGNEKVMAVDIEECIKKWLMRASDREGGRAGRKPSGIREHDNMMWSDGNNM